MPFKKPKFEVVTNKKPGKGELIISGYINPYNNNSASAIRKAFRELEAEYKEIDIYILNCNGGSVFEGLPTVNYIQNSSVKVNTIVEGLAASMGAIIFLAGSKRYMAKNSRVMLHRAQGGIYGDASQIEDYSKMIEDAESDLINVIVEAGNLDEEEVKSKFMNTGKDVYLNFKQAKKFEFVHGEVKGLIKEDLPADIANENFDTISNYYQEQISNTIKVKKMDQKELAKKLGLPEDATQVQIEAKIEELKAIKPAKEDTEEGSPSDSVANRLDALENELKVEKTEKVNNLVDGAIAAKKINADQKDSWLKLANSDYDSAKASLDGMHSAIKPTDVIVPGGSTEGVKTPANKADWSFDNYLTNDAEALVAMRAEKFDDYAKLFNDHYGYQPERS